MERLFEYGSMSESQKRKVLEVHRQRLLDLTLRNSLLNFSQTGKKVIPIIDELPNEVFRILVDSGTTMALDPFFDPALSGVTAPAEAQPQLDLLPYQSKKSNGTELSIRQNISPVKKSAQKLEDLPNPGESRPEFVDDRLQTSLSLKEYEQRLANVQNEHRQLLDSTGSNFLYLAIGFLKWFAPQDPDKARMAPLLLVPLEIVRTKETVSLTGDDGEEYEASHFAYSVKHSGELSSGNYTLQLKVRSCYPTVDIPEPQLADEGFEPEDYLNQVSTLCRSLQLSSSPQWSVERKMGVTFFASGKEVMYRDLDPKNWPEDGLLDGELVSAALGYGAPREDREENTSGQIDSKVFYREPIPTVLEADSSQMRALQTALSEKSTVIQGPPGTGKSQTIANLIGALLNEGRKVLFMAEKPEALNVVASRLSEVGLGDLCVELHSQKATPKHFQEQLQRRLSREGQIVGERLKGTLTRLENNREILDNYGAELINKERGGENSLYSALWKRERALQTLSDEWDQRQSHQKFQAEAFVRLCSATTLGTQGYIEGESAFRKVGRAWDEQVLDVAKYWGPFSPEKILHAGDVEQIETLFKKGKETLQSFVEGIANDSQFFSLEKRCFYESCVLLRHLILLEQPSPDWTDFLDDVAALIGNFSQTQLEEDLSSWHQAMLILKENRESRGYDELFATNEPTDNFLRFDRLQLEQFQQAVKEALTRPVLFGNQSETSLKSVEKIMDAQTLEESLRSSLERICEELKLKGDYSSVAKIKMLLQLLKEAIQLDRHTKGALCDELLNVQASSRAYKEAFAEYEKHTEAKDLIGTLLKLRSLAGQPEATTILQPLRELAVSFWKYPLFGRKARAKRIAKQLRSNPKLKVTSPEWLDALEDGLLHLKDLETFRQDRYFSQHLGPEFKGYDSSWETLQRAMAFSQRLNGLEEQDVAAFSEFSCDESLDSVSWDSRLREFERTLDALIGHQAFEVMEMEIISPTDLSSIRQELEKNSEQITRVANILAGWSSWEHAPFEDIQQEISQGELCYEQFMKAQDAANIFGGELVLTAKTLDWEKIESLFSAKVWISEFLGNVVLSDPEFKLILEGGDQLQWQERRTNFECLLNQYGKFEATVKSLTVFGHVQAGSVFSNSPVEVASTEMVEAWSPPRKAFQELSLWSDYQVSLGAIRKLGLVDLVKFCEKNCRRAAALTPALQLWYWNRKAEKALDKSSAVNSASRYDLEESIRDFKKLDKSLAERYRDAVAKRAFAETSQMPSGNSRGLVGSYSEMGLVDKQASLTKGLCPVREFVRRAPKSLSGLFPCWMMSPSSIAKFLPPEGIQFDVVVIDEASQVKPEDALGALARAKRAVIVGDSKQMPPSNFFSVIQASPDDEEYEQSVGESILEVAEGKQCFEKERLRWHYRSLHQSLISFSNERYYSGELIVPPSVESKNNELGVQWNYVDNAFFQTGLNEIEAQEITASFKAHIFEEAGKPSEERSSLGLVVMNAKQASRIRELLDQSRLKDADFARAYDEFHSDDFPEAFVRNLERVQGDERDVIFVGFTYGPDPESGKVVRRFGPINGPAGSRRLNVLLTRSRKSLRIFASMKRDQLLGGTASSGGVRDLADYLGFAEQGQYYEAGSKTGREPDSDFEISVANLISALGYEVDFQVGVAGFFVDLGIRRPGESRYFCGIECDGATYHSHPIARDRDRLRQDILEARGWNIYRVWSTDWFRNRDREVDRLQAFLQDAI